MTPTFGWKKDKYDSRDKIHPTVPAGIPAKVVLDNLLPPVRDQGNIGCYDAQAEALTKRGWKLFADVTVDDEILCFDPEDKTLRYDKPLQFFTYDYDGDMVHFQGDAIDLPVTPNHNMLLNPWDESARTISDVSRFTKAEDVGWYFDIPCTGNWFGEKTEFFHLPGQKIGPYHGGVGFRGSLDIETNKWVQFLGIYLAEGYTCPENDYEVGIAAVKAGKKERVEALLAAMPFHYGEGTNRFRIYNKALCLELEPLGEARDKHCPEFIKGLPSHQIKMFLDAFGLGDGHWNETGTWTFYTSSKQLADDLQELIIKTGAWAQILYRPGRSSVINGRTVQGSGEYCLRVASRQHLSIERERMVSREAYKGKVYCVEVPTHAMVVRRNGKPLICGNSCTGFGIGANLYAVARALGINTEWFSPTFIYNGARFIEGTLTQDAGAEPGDCLDWLLHNGALLEHFWPYNPDTLDMVAPSAERLGQANKYPGFAYFRCVDGVAGICSAIAAGHVVSLGAPWFDKWMDAPGGVLQPVTAADYLRGGHETCIYGYDQNAGVLFGLNSWGASWGRNGLYSMEFGAIDVFKQLGGYDAQYITFEAGPMPGPTPSTCPIGNGIAKFAGKTMNIMPALLGRRGRFYVSYKNP